MAKDWENYQEEVATFFRTLGLTAITNAKVEGTRGSHAVDVWVVSTRYGFQIRWIVECKLWQTAIPKEKVLALHQIAQDIGADRAFLLSESGFQSGAIRAVRQTNITLTSLEDLQSSGQEEIFNFALSALAYEISSLDAKIHDFMADEDGRPLPYAWIDREQLIGAAGTILEMRLSLPKAQARRFPIYFAVERGNRATEIRDLNIYITTANKSLRLLGELVAGFEVATQTVQQKERERFRVLVNASQKLLINAEECLFSPTESITRFEELRRRSLRDMQEVGKAADEAIYLAYGQLKAQLLLLMRLLIASIYLHLTEVTISQKEWDNSKQAILNQLEIIDSHIAFLF